MNDFEMMMVDGRPIYFSFGGEFRGLENIDSFLWGNYYLIHHFTHRLIGGIDDFLPVLEECDFLDVVVWRARTQEDYWFIKYDDSGNIIVITDNMEETHVLTKSLGWGRVSGSEKEWLFFKSLPEAVIALNRYFSEEA